MKVKLVILAAVIMALAIPSAASASWYVSKSTAEHAARVIVHDKYGDTGVYASCRPYGQEHTSNPRYDYHRWVCGWAADAVFQDGSDALCSGQLSIAGSHVYQWQYRVLRGERCT